MQPHFGPRAPGSLYRLVPLSSALVQTGRYGDQIPVEARFSTPVHTGPGAHPASCKMGTESFPGGKERPGRGADPSSPSSAVVMKE